MCSCCIIKGTKLIIAFLTPIQFDSITTDVSQLFDYSDNYFNIFELLPINTLFI